MSTRLTALCSVRRAATAAVLAVASTGCSFGNGPEFLNDYQRPAPGEKVPDSFWTRAAGAQDSVKKGDTGALELSFWLLPSWVSGRHTTLTPEAESIQGGLGESSSPRRVDESVTDTRFQVLDLGVIFIPFLPLWMYADTQLDRRTGERAESGTAWTPLSTTRWSSGWPADKPRITAHGLPLLYGRVEFGCEGEEPAFEMHNLLWTLGPAWMRIDMPDEEPHATGWGFSLLMLGGPGTWLWSSADIQSDESDFTVHGPFSGWLGYRSELEHRPSGVFWTPPSASSAGGPSLFTRHIVAGALWYDSEETFGDVVTQARHGPLWGVFGWGRSSVEPVIYLFWFPVEV